jgi:hypothetical protein
LKFEKIYWEHQKFVGISGILKSGKKLVIAGVWIIFYKVQHFLGILRSFRSYEKLWEVLGILKKYQEFWECQKFFRSL